jgi:curli biogenesis system outer membrane secretion channel CsgG
VLACAVLMATALLLPAMAQSTRPSIAVLSFDYGSIQRWWDGNQDIGEGISDLLVDELVNDGSFRVFERKRLNTLLAEQNFQDSDRVDPTAKLAKIGKMLGVKYVVAGSVTKFGTEQSSKGIGGGGGGVINFSSSDFRDTILGEATEAAVKATVLKLVAAKTRLELP